ncbi:MAG: glycoside hydrolase family 57 protein [Candidatus Omnitrophota bacterium]
MLYVAFIWHMHQPYYKDLLTGEFHLPWVRLHAVKDYLDMVRILEGFPKIHQTFNLVPSLIEQIQDYAKGDFKERFYELSLKNSRELSTDEKKFILENFFSADPERIISIHPRYCELYLKKQANLEFNPQDFLDLQVWFNLAWIDSLFRKESTQLTAIVRKGRFFSEEEKNIVLKKQIEIIGQVLPAYRKFQDAGQIEVSITPYYHPILPLLYNNKSAIEANPKTVIPKVLFRHPEDIKYHIDAALKLYQEVFNRACSGMWPSEQAINSHILPFIAEAKINWVVTDEAILFKSLRKTKPQKSILYRPYSIEADSGHLNILFRDSNISNKIGFVYHRYKTEEAINDFMKSLDDAMLLLEGQDGLITIALDGENAWEYYPNDGWDFLSGIYKRISENPELKTVTVSEYLNMHPHEPKLNKISAGSWINADFTKWIGNYEKNLAWEYLAKAREELSQSTVHSPQSMELAWKQIYVAEGSDWFWWYGDDVPSFDSLFRRHLSNFYKLIERPVPDYLNKPIKRPS